MLHGIKYISVLLAFTPAFITSCNKKSLEQSTLQESKGFFTTPDPAEVKELSGKIQRFLNKEGAGFDKPGESYHCSKIIGWSRHDRSKARNPQNYKTVDSAGRSDGMPYYTYCAQTIADAAAKADKMARAIVGVCGYLTVDSRSRQSCIANTAAQIAQESKFDDLEIHVDNNDGNHRHSFTFGLMQNRAASTGYDFTRVGATELLEAAGCGRHDVPEESSYRNDSIKGWDNGNGFWAHPACNIALGVWYVAAHSHPSIYNKDMTKIKGACLGSNGHYDAGDKGYLAHVGPYDQAYLQRIDSYRNNLFGPDVARRSWRVDEKKLFKECAPAVTLPRPETPKPETPKPETPKPETPKPETPKPETPKPETPKPETPIVQQTPQSTPASPFSATSAANDSKVWTDPYNGNRFPYCRNSFGGGWGWEDNQSCKQYPYCQNSRGSGWGWEDNQSCKQYQYCRNSFGGGWGWEDNQSCKQYQYCRSSFGNGWGWEDNQSCKQHPYCRNSFGDGWGWEDNQSCKQHAQH
jgi:cell division septation protein DedD